MARPRLQEDRPLSATERVQRFRRQRRARRLEVHLDVISFDQVGRIAERWGTSRQEVLVRAFQACLPALKRTDSARELFDQVRTALEAAGIE